MGDRHRVLTSGVERETTDAPINGFPVSSLTVPLTVLCEIAADVTIRTENSKSKSFFISHIFVKKNKIHTHKHNNCTY